MSMCKTMSKGIAVTAFTDYRLQAPNRTAEPDCWTRHLYSVSGVRRIKIGEQLDDGGRYALLAGNWDFSHARFYNPRFLKRVRRFQITLECHSTFLKTELPMILSLAGYFFIFTDIEIISNDKSSYPHDTANHKNAISWTIRLP